MIAAPTFRLSIALLMAGTSLPALAQEMPPAAEEAVPAEDVIIVTAQKIEQRQKDVPLTLTAMSGDQATQLGARSLADISAYVPGLNVQEQSANNPGFVIRGLTSDSGAANQSARVTVYYNGIDVSRARGAYVLPFDMNRVEVVKGPQSTLFGTAAEVGAISMIPNLPKAGASASLTSGIGNFDYHHVAGMVNAGDDVFAGRIAFDWEKRRGYVKNLMPGEDDLQGIDQVGARGSLRWHPSADFTATATFTYERQRNPGTAFISGTLPRPGGSLDVYGPAALGGAPHSYAVFGKDRLGLTRDVYDANLTLNWDIAPQWTLTSINGFRQFDSYELFDADGSQAWFLQFGEDAHGWQASHETRLAYTSDRFRGFIGANMFIERGRQRVPFSTEEGTLVQCAQHLIPNLPCVAADGSVTAAAATALLTKGLFKTLPYSGAFGNQGRNEAYSLFADATFIPTPAVELTAGLRGVYEKRKSGFAATMPGSVLMNLMTRNPQTPNGLNVPLLPGMSDTADKTYWASDDYFSVLPRFNILYRATPAVNLYATISKGRRSAIVDVIYGANPAVDPYAQNPSMQVANIPAETLWNFEGGVKGAWRGISGALSAFYQKYNNFLIFVQEGGRAVPKAAGTARNYGVEGEIMGRPAAWLQLFANAAYTNARIEDKASNGLYAGQRFRLQPEWQASAGFTIDAPMGGDMRFFLTPSVTYRSKIYFEQPNSDLLSQDAVTLINARGGVSFANDRFEVAGFVKNAGNDRYLLDAGNAGASFGYPTFIPAAPRLYGVEFTAHY